MSRQRLRAMTVAELEEYIQGLRADRNDLKRAMLEAHAILEEKMAGPEGVSGEVLATDGIPSAETFGKR